MNECDRSCTVAACFTVTDFSRMGYCHTPYLLPVSHWDGYYEPSLRSWAILEQLTGNQCSVLETSLSLMASVRLESRSHWFGDLANVTD